MAESDIWRWIAAHPDKVGFPDALHLDQVQLGRHAGYVDLVLLPDPTATQVKLVLIEAKRIKNPESSDKVVGQLLKYYARALKLGTEGVAALRNAAEREALGVKRPGGSLLSIKKIFGTNDQFRANSLLKSGERLSPGDVALIVALDGYTGIEARRLGFIVSTLRHYHRLPIDLYEIRDGVATVCNASLDEDDD